MIDRCEFCKFWRRSSDSQTGDCRHNEPAMDDTGGSRWPVTSADDWCGQFEEGAELDDAAKERRSDLLGEESRERMRREEESRERYVETMRKRAAAYEGDDGAPDE